MQKFEKFILHKLHLRVSAFCKIQIKSNNQLCVDLGLYLSLESTSAHHKRCGNAVGKVIAY